MKLRQRLRYRFDNLLARGTGATLLWLGLVTIGAILVSSLLLAIFDVRFSGSEDGSWLEDFWQSMLRILDPGTMAGDVGWGRRLLALTVTIFGLLVAGTLIGIIAAGVEDRIERMRRGRSPVVARDHLVILGGMERVPVIVDQLVQANGAEAATIVVLADDDPSRVRAAVNRVASHRGRTEVIYRNGDATDPDDLAIVGIERARAVVVLAQGPNDSAAVRTLLAIRAAQRRLDGAGDEPQTPTVVVDVVDPAIGPRLRRAFGPTVHPLSTEEALARTAAFALRQRGLSQVIAELTDFRSADVHVAERPEVVGLRFADVIGRYETARAIGVVHVDGRIELAPPPQTVVSAGQRLVLIAEDARELQPALNPLDLGVPEPAASAAGLAVDSPRGGTERMAIIGWNALGRRLFAEWARTADPASTLDVGYDPQVVDPASITPPPEVSTTVTPVDDLDRWLTTMAPTTIVLLAAEGLEATDADARTLLDLTETRRLMNERSDLDPPRYVVELRLPDDVGIVELPGREHVVISAAIGSQLIAQLVQQPARRDVLLELYAGHGATVRMIPCEHLGLVGDHPFADAVTRAYATNAIAIGWWPDAAAGGALTLCPALGDRTVLREGDDIVVIG